MNTSNQNQYTADNITI